MMHAVFLLSLGRDRECLLKLKIAFSLQLRVVSYLVLGIHICYALCCRVLMLRSHEYGSEVGLTRDH